MIGHDPKKPDKILSLGNKQFVLQPLGLLRHLDTLPLTETTRRVFWYHWNLSYRASSIETQIPVAEVADHLGVSRNSISRAYTQLIEHQLIERIPTVGHHCPGVTITRIDLPDALLTVLLEEPDRRNLTPTPADHTDTADPAVVPEPPTINHAPPETADLPLVLNEPPAEHPVANDPREKQRERLVRLQSERDTLETERVANPMDYAVLRRIHELDAQIGVLTNRIEQGDTRLNEPPTPLPTTPVPARPPENDNPKRPLPPTLRQLLEERIAQLSRISSPQQLINEIVYSIECGVQRTQGVLHAINAALKLVREGRWRTPYGFQKSRHPA